jgi:hypothetical protein
MAASSISAIACLISGATVTPLAYTTASGDTVLIYGPSNQRLDLSRLVIRISNAMGVGGVTAGSGIKVNISASSSYSAAGQGPYSVTIGSAATVVIGGKQFESTRFMNVSAQCVILQMDGTAGGTATCAIEAYQLPSGVTG